MGDGRQSGCRREMAGDCDAVNGRMRWKVERLGGRFAGNDLCIGVSGMRGELQVLFHGMLGVKRNLEAGELWDRLRPYCAIRE